MLFGPPMLGLLADFTKVRWAFVADATVLLLTAGLFAALAGEPGRGLYLPPAEAVAAAAAVAAADGRCSGECSPVRGLNRFAKQHAEQLPKAAGAPALPGGAAVG